MMKCVLIVGLLLVAGQGLNANGTEREVEERGGFWTPRTEKILRDNIKLLIDKYIATCT